MNRPDEWADYLDPVATDPDLPSAHREALDRFAAVLADEAVWSDPPSELRGAVLDRAMQEAPGADGVSPAASPLPAPRFGGSGRAPDQARGRRREARARSSSRPVWWLSVAAAAAAAALVVTLAWPRPATTAFAMHGTSAAPRASATAELDARSAGLSITLKIAGLAAAPPGTYYAAWLRGPAGVVPVGTFHWHKGGIPIELWSGVLTDRYPELFVTLQREGESPAPSTDVVLTGRAPSS